MHLLREGITGFDAPARVDLAGFKRAVHAAARSSRAAILDAVTDGVTSNFHRIDVRRDALAFSILCNRHFPVAAFTERAEAGTLARFIDGVPGEFVEALESSGFAVASAVELERRPGPADVDRLAPAERKQVRYWGPRRVGEIVFNSWD